MVSVYNGQSSKLREGKLQEIAGQNGGKSTAKGAYGYVSNTYTSNFPTTSFQPIQECGLSSFIPQASSLTNYINYASVQVLSFQTLFFFLVFYYGLFFCGYPRSWFSISGLGKPCSIASQFNHFSIGCKYFPVE